MNKLSLEDCVKSVLTNSREEVWKAPARLAKKLIKYDYLSQEELIKATNMFYSLNPISYQYKKGKKDKYHSCANIKSWDVFLKHMNNCITKFIKSKSKANQGQEQEQGQEPSIAPYCKAPSLGLVSVLDYRTKDQVRALGGMTRQVINIDNLNYVFALCVNYSRNKAKFYLSINGHGIEAKIVYRNLRRLETLGLIKQISKGRQYNLKNILSGLTNLASEYELLVTPILKPKEVLAPSINKVVEVVPEWQPEGLNSSLEGVFNVI